MDIQGKVFIVTGGASGLGEGTARALASRGGPVVVADMQAAQGASFGLCGGQDGLANSSASACAGRASGAQASP